MLINSSDAVIGVLIENLILNLDYIELAFRLPELTWGQIITTLGMITVWKLVCHQLDRIAFAQLRRWISAMLMR